MTVGEKNLETFVRLNYQKDKVKEGSENPDIYVVFKSAQKFFNFVFSGNGCSLALSCPLLIPPLTTWKELYYVGGNR